MKTIGWSRLLAVAAAVLLAASTSAQNADPLVFVLAGQSNMAGQGVTAELTPDQRVSQAGSLWLDAGEAGFFDGERFGPEVTLARRLADAIPGRELIFVKHALGGTSLLAWAPEWDEARAEITGNAAAGPVYAQFVDLVDDLDFPEDVEFGAIFWMQGERDALFPGPAAEYFENLDRLVTAFRWDLSDPALPFILGLANPLPERYTELAVVQAAQRRAAAEIAGVHLVDTAGLTKHDDGVHYDTGGILELGRRLAKAYLAVR